MAIGTKRKASNTLSKQPLDLPPGTIHAFAGSTAPEGWALCDGTAISRTTYAALYSAIGDAWGNGDGSTTFHLPDLRGRFLRGVDNAQGRDPDRASRTAANSGGNTGDLVGSIQGHAAQSHSHSMGGQRGSSISNGGPALAGSAANYGPAYTVAGTTISTATASGTHAQASTNETRPVNANVNYIIKL